MITSIFLTSIAIGFGLGAAAFTTGGAALMLVGLWLMTIGLGTAFMLTLRKKYRATLQTKFDAAIAGTPA